jgi:hypothetical protein
VRRRLGLVVAFTGGYYFGAKAGRLRYEQIRSRLAEALHSAPVEKARTAFANAVTSTVNGQDAATSAPSGPPASSRSR